MPDPSAPGPGSPRDPKQPEIRTLSRRATRLFVVAAVVFVIVAAFISAYLLVRSAQDPEVQQRVQEMQRQMEAAAADSARADTTAADAPAPEQDN